MAPNVIATICLVCSKTLKENELLSEALLINEIGKDLCADYGLFVNEQKI